MAKKQTHIIRLERGDGLSIFPKDFYSLLVMRFLPVISLVYIASVIGIAGNHQDILHYVFKDKSAYLMSGFIVLFSSVPAIIWIFLRSSPMFSHVANLWYRIIAAIIVIAVSLGFVLFPEGGIYGLRIYLVLSIPVFWVIDILFIREWLSPSMLSYLLNAIGISAIIYGVYINVIY